MQKHFQALNPKDWKQDGLIKLNTMMKPHGKQTGLCLTGKTTAAT